MSPAIVMLVALSGLGCQNKTDSRELPVVLSPAAASPSPEVHSASTSPPPYPRYYPESYPDPEDLYNSRLGCLRATLYSFVFGKDPGIPSASEIEASVFGYGNGN